MVEQLKSQYRRELGVKGELFLAYLSNNRNVVMSRLNVTSKDDICI